VDHATRRNRERHEDDVRDVRGRLRRTTINGDTIGNTIGNRTAAHAIGVEALAGDQDRGAAAPRGARDPPGLTSAAAA
jgi:hypothetical protein